MLRVGFGQPSRRWRAVRRMASPLEKPVRASMPGSDGDIRTPFHFSLAGSFAGRKSVAFAIFAVGVPPAAGCFRRAK